MYMPDYICDTSLYFFMTLLPLKCKGPKYLHALAFSGPFTPES